MNSKEEEDKDLIELKRRLNSLRSSLPSPSSPVKHNTSSIPPQTISPASSYSSPLLSPILSPEESSALEDQVAAYLTEASLSVPSDLPSDTGTTGIENAAALADLEKVERLMNLFPPSPSSSSRLRPRALITSSTSPKTLEGISPIEILYLAPSRSIPSQTLNSNSNSNSKLNDELEEGSEEALIITQTPELLDIEDSVSSVSNSNSRVKGTAEAGDWEERFKRLSEGIQVSNLTGEEVGTERGIKDERRSIGVVPDLKGFEKFEKRRRRKREKLLEKKGEKQGSSSSSDDDESSESSDSEESETEDSD